MSCLSNMATITIPDPLPLFVQAVGLGKSLGHWDEFPSTHLVLIDHMYKVVHNVYNGYIHNWLTAIYVELIEF